MNRLRIMMLSAALSVATGMASAAPPNEGDGYYCPYGRYIGNGHCSDGTIAVYRGNQPVSPSRQEVVQPRGSLMGAWSTEVPGAVWTTASVFPGWRTLHIAPGALAGLLVIYPNHRYVWNAYGGKKGAWSSSSDPEYPILLDDKAEGRKWKVGFNTHQPNAIYIVESNGYYWYEGRRAN